MKKHILLIDENKTELIVFMDALRKVPVDDGFKCTYAASPQHASEMLKYLIPDYIICDLTFSNANGLNFVAQLINIPHFSRTLFCLYAINMTEETVHAAASLGAKCLHKTSDTERLAFGLVNLFATKRKSRFPLALRN